MYTGIYFGGNSQVVKFVYRKCPIFLRYCNFIGEEVPKESAFWKFHSGIYTFRTIFHKL